MATTPYPYGRFIGRIGALAVALGVGAAIASSPGIAVADDGSSTPSGASSPDSAAGPGGTSGRQSTTPSNSSDSSPSSASGSAKDSQLGGARHDKADGPKGDEDKDEDNGAGASLTSAPPESVIPDETGNTSDPGDDGEEKTSSDRRTGLSQRRTTSSSQSTPLHTDESVTKAQTFTAAAIDPQPSSIDTAASFALAPQPTQRPSETIVTALSVPSTPASVNAPLTPRFGGFISTVLSSLGIAPQAANDGPVAPQQPPTLWALLGWARREIGYVGAPSSTAAMTPAAATSTQSISSMSFSPLGTPEQLAAERMATETANTLPVTLMKLVLRQGFLFAAQQHFPGGPDAENLAALDDAVDEYAMAAAFQQQLLNPMTPTVVTQVAPPHNWYGQVVGGSRILYDNPDTIYRFMSVSATSEYVITGRFSDLTEDGMPADVSFSVLEGLAGTTSSILTADDLEINEDGTFTITVSAEPANGRKNHLQLTNSSTIVAARDTLGDWAAEVPMSLSIQRVSGPPNSLFAQVGGFAFLGSLVSGNPLLTTVVSLVPPLPYMPAVLRGTFTALILVVRGVSEQSKYMALATTDPQTGARRPPNVLSQPASNAEFLANQLQSNGYYELEDTEVIVLTIDPGDAGYFIVPTYNIWTITDDYWNQQTSLNNEQAIPNGDGTYTVVISPTDPGATNWVSTGGFNQGTISIRFQDLKAGGHAPRILGQRVMTHQELRNYLPPDAFVTGQQRAQQLELRKAGYNTRWAPYPQL